MCKIIDRWRREFWEDSEVGGTPVCHSAWTVVSLPLCLLQLSCNSGIKGRFTMPRKEGTCELIDVAQLRFMRHQLLTLPHPPS